MTIEQLSHDVAAIAYRLIAVLDRQPLSLSVLALATLLLWQLKTSPRGASYAETPAFLEALERLMRELVRCELARQAKPS